MSAAPQSEQQFGGGVGALAPGLYPHVNADDYHARELGVVSKGALDRIAVAPSEYFAWVNGSDAKDQDEETAALRFGKAFHCAALEPVVFFRTHAIAPDFGDCRTKGPKDARDAWRKANSGKTWVSADDGTTIAGMVAALHAHPLASRILAKGQPELTARWDDPDTGLRCKARADWYVPDMRLMADLKSTTDPRPFAFVADAGLYGYHRQDALYRRVFAGAGATISNFVFVAVRKAPPHLAAIYELGRDEVDAGDAQNRRHMNTLATCLRENRWPGLPETIQTIQLKAWHLQ